jgi:hypothetical protein
VEIGGLFAKLSLSFAPFRNVLIQHKEGAYVAVFQQRYTVNLDVNQLSIFPATFRCPMHRLFFEYLGNVGVHVLPKAPIDNQISCGLADRF